MQTITRKAVGFSAVALLTAGLIAGTAESAAAVTATFAYPSQATCVAAEEHYVEIHWRITKGCQWYFIERTDPNSWMFTAKK